MLDRIAEAVKKGIALADTLVIDCHCHLGGIKNFYVPETSAASMVAVMDTLGVDKACISSFPAISSDYRMGNELLFEALSKFPDRFLGYATANPNYPDDMVPELDRCFSVDRVIGIKLHPSAHGCSIDHANNHIVYRYAVQHHLPILIHVWGQKEVREIDGIADRYEDLTLIMGHGGAEIRAMEMAVEVVKRHENVYVDLAVSIAREGNVEWFVQQMGAQRILFGTDMPFLDPRPTLGRVALAQISEPDKKKILSENFQNILKRCPGIC